MNNEACDLDFEWEERGEDTPFKVHLAAGSVAGIAEHVLLLPFDNLKTHLQTRSASLGEAFREIRASGLRSFYRGSAIIAMGCIPSHALFFFNYEFLRKRITQFDRIDIIGHMLTGGISTLCHDLIMTPCDMLKQRSQLALGSTYRSIVAETMRNEGLAAFWRSLPVNLVTNLPNSMITVAANENLKFLYRRSIGEPQLPGFFLCAATAGALSALFTTPLDNIKTRLNVQQFFANNLQKIKNGIHDSMRRDAVKDLLKESLPQHPALRRVFTDYGVNLPGCKCNPFNSEAKGVIKYPNAWCSAKIICREEGLRGFFKGLSMKMAVQSLSSAVSWSIYETCKTFLISRKVF